MAALRKLKRALILRAASHLDAFSGYLRQNHASPIFGFIINKKPVQWFFSGFSAHLATQHILLVEELAYSRCVLPSPLVLRKSPLSALTPTPDMDRTVSRRSEPSSRTAFMGEQPNPWDVLPPQVAMSRHRGAKPSRRCELLGKISLLSLE